jgi:hypothetical protein
MKKLKGDKHLLRLGRTLLRVLGENAKNERVVVPVLRTIVLLAKHGAVGSAVGGGGGKGLAKDEIIVNDFDDRLFELVQTEADRSKSYKKIVSVVDVLVLLVLGGSEGEEVGVGGEGGGGKMSAADKAAKFIMLLLAHPFPKIRKYVRERERVKGVCASERASVKDGHPRRVRQPLYQHPVLPSACAAPVALHHVRPSERQPTQFVSLLLCGSPVAGGVRGVSPRQPEILPASATEERLQPGAAASAPSALSFLAVPP